MAKTQVNHSKQFNVVRGLTYFLHIQWATWAKEKGKMKIKTKKRKKKY